MEVDIKNSINLIKSPVVKKPDKLESEAGCIYDNPSDKFRNYFQSIYYNKYDIVDIWMN